MGKRRLKPTSKAVYHHVMTRTAQGVYWLQEPEVKEIFNELVDFYTQVYYVKDLARTCMSNHTHLVLEINRPEFDLEDVRRRYELAQTRLVKKRPFREDMAEYFYKKYTDLSFFMWDINKRMAVRHNEMKKTNGHLWGARFKNVVVEPGESLLKVIAYVELNAVRAKLVEDPSDFPYCNVGRIKNQQEQGLKPKVPQIPLLEQLPEEVRAPIYVAFMRYVAIAQAEPELHRQQLPIQFTRIGIEVNLNALCQALKSREPGKWSNLIYGSKAFAENTLIEAGWLIPLKRRKEESQKAPPEAA